MSNSDVVLNTETLITDETIAELQQMVEQSVEVPLKRQWHCETSLDSDEGRRCVALDLKMTNQRDDVTTVAKALVVAPR